MARGFRFDQRSFRTVLALFSFAAVSETPATDFLVTTTGDSGPGSLRQAISDANSSPGPHRILFRIPGAAPHSIQLQSALPAINETMTIDAQPQPFPAARAIELNGDAAGQDSVGLEIAANNCQVRGLCLGGFASHGILIDFGEDNLLEGNFIGTNPAGTVAHPNGGAGIAVSDSAANRLGSAPAGANLISGNLTGIFVVGSGSVSNQVQGNFIGVDVTGTNALPNQRNGVLIFDAGSNLVGGSSAGARNIVSGNGQSGVYVTGSDAELNVIAGNYIGIDATGGKVLSNKVDGVTIFAASLNQVGGTNTAARNVISGNGERGILINGSGASSNVVAGNFIGTDAAGAFHLGNGFSGVGIVDVTGNTIGGAAPGARNVVSGNSQSGIAISGAGASNNVVQGNFLGTDATGLLAVSNRFNGISIIDSPGNLIGGATAALANVISGNLENGVFISGATASANRLEGNVIGVNSAGSAALANGVDGVQISAPQNEIGRTGGRPNVIAGNLEVGVYVFSATAVSNRIQGNFIGTDLAGKAPLPNVGGILISDAPGTTIGGSGTGAGNLISGNRESGVYLSGGGCSNSVVQGNRIGLDAGGQLGLANAGDGVSIYGASGNLVGSPDPAAGNFIAANGFSGLFLTGASASNNVVQGNFIGSQLDGVSPAGNRLYGIELDDGASNNRLGGPASTNGNKIAFNGAGGVRLHAGAGNRIRYNSIVANLGLGIDLGVDGVTPNDSGDLDEGANRLQNFPDIGGVTAGASTVIGGVLNSRTNDVFTLDFYRSDSADDSGYGEGAAWIGAASVRTDNSGRAVFNLALPSATAAGKFITATATDASGNTSEFSRAVPARVGDSDGDGLPDAYELSVKLNPFDPSDAGLDADGDGFTNLQEYIAGTNPHDSSSLPRLQQRLGTDGANILSFETSPGRRYQLQYAEQLGGVWRAIAQFDGGGAPYETQNGPFPAGNRFYRLSITLSP